MRQHLPMAPDPNRGSFLGDGGGGCSPAEPGPPELPLLLRGSLRSRAHTSRRSWLHLQEHKGRAAHRTKQQVSLGTACASQGASSILSQQRGSKYQAPLSIAVWGSPTWLGH